ncbi:3-isopropylmalate dehydratase [Handroanthus impetiginosus]|uniref:3-isopropylmalate dehydratase n=1 Tax=Handroanthus impetiginosus TaxID=429701 RepID=A0A2G9GHV8_9LAMI|nr:3-isopropylmalate dehydratase [Handroanthus impetiginosus]
MNQFIAMDKQDFFSSTDLISQRWSRWWLRFGWIYTAFRFQDPLEKKCSQIFEEAGCDTPASPRCGACLGGPRDTYARMNEPQVCVSATNRNFPGRMGHKEGQIYLPSPYTAAASAVTGFVTDPREFLQ